MMVLLTILIRSEKRETWKFHGTKKVVLQVPKRYSSPSFTIFLLPFASLLTIFTLPLPFPLSPLSFTRSATPFHFQIFHKFTAPLLLKAIISASPTSFLFLLNFPTSLAPLSPSFPLLSSFLMKPLSPPTHLLGFSSSSSPPFLHPCQPFYFPF